MALSNKYYVQYSANEKAEYMARLDKWLAERPNSIRMCDTCRHQCTFGDPWTCYGCPVAFATDMAGDTEYWREPEHNYPTD